MAKKAQIPRIVILGAGFAGLEVAKTLRHQPVRVTLIDKRNHHLFQPLLYQVASGALPAEDVTQPMRDLFRDVNNVDIVMDDVTDIDREQTVVKTVNAEFPYDHLVIATGSKTSYFGNEKWAKYALPLKSVDDATKIRHRLYGAYEQAEISTEEKERERLMSVVIVGGGPTGVEMAGALADMANRTLPREFHHIDTRKTRIVLAEMDDHLLPGFPKKLAGYTEKKLRNKGVTLRLGEAVEDIDEDGVVIGDERIEAETVVWAAGISPTEAADWLGVESEKGLIEVDEYLRLPDTKNIYVIGDLAREKTEDGDPLPALAAVAKQEGRYVGRRLRDLAKGRQGGKAFHYRDYGILATIGRGAAVADFGFMTLKGYLAWLLWGAVHVFQLLGVRNRLGVLLNWFWQYLTLRRGSQLITTDRKPGDKKRENKKSGNKKPRNKKPGNRISEQSVKNA